MLAADPLFGLVTAASLDIKLFLLIDVVTDYLLYQLTANSDTVGDALRRYERFFPTSHDTARAHLDFGPDSVTVHYLIPGERQAARVCTEWIVGGLAKMLSDAPHVRVAPREVSFVHDAAGSVDRCTRLLGGPVRFGAEANTIVLPRAALDIAMQTAKPSLIGLLEARAGAQLRVRQEAGLAARVRASIEVTIEKGPASAAATARRLGVSERTLIRRLQAEGTSHQEILNQVRSDLARRYLTQERVVGDELATRLGYSNVRSFQRASNVGTGAPLRSFWTNRSTKQAGECEARGQSSCSSMWERWSLRRSHIRSARCSEAGADNETSVVLSYFRSSS